MQRNYAYLRVSTKEQNLNRQLDAIKQLNEYIDERDIYVDKISGRDFNRPGWQALKRSIRSGDTLFIHSLDRLGRNKTQILQEWQWLVDNKINLLC
ncbi:MAG TPA: recombinase family protein [Hungateiclostridium thermocellum]|uniref:recombinase family protein n=1 Tax=Acetivibrio thermocellus TaxID=1515 RepID=UPI0000F21956|nr:recombinase family protein [Acetivibrio thermocellus]HBW26614.1 recombinase family protein [Acetivibrio thermocellus]